jgi:hypothetical protein
MVCDGGRIMILLSLGVSIIFGVAINDRFFRMFESRLEFKMVLLCLLPLPPLTLERILDGVCGKSGSANDTAGDSFDPGVLDMFD